VPQIGGAVARKVSGLPVISASDRISFRSRDIQSVAMRFFGSNKRTPELVTNGRFELERDGQVAYLEYTVAGDVLELLHSEIPQPLRGTGIASTLAKTALDWARDRHMRVDVVCPFVAAYLSSHPEYSDLVMP
jgi:uncharacterized protein